ncbi:MAG: hypothetical protein WBA10_06700 [Elainellaceae cyanobacterium]
MTDPNRSATNLNRVDSPINVIVAAVLIFGSITWLVIWALQSAYAFG